MIFLEILLLQKWIPCPIGLPPNLASDDYTPPCAVNTVLLQGGHRLKGSGGDEITVSAHCLVQLPLFAQPAPMEKEAASD